MKTINFQQYRDIVVNEILNYGIKQLQNKYSNDIKFIYSIINDLSLGPGSPNYKFIKKISKQQNIPAEFIINSANRLISGIDYDGSVNYYEVLNVRNDAATVEIRDSWLNLVKQNHPDLVGDTGIEKTKELNEAYEVLKDREKRREYDFAFFDYYPLYVKEKNFSGLYSRKYLMAYSVVLVLAISFFLKGYFENFINEDKNNHSIAQRQLEYFEEVNKEKSKLKYDKDVEELYTKFYKNENADAEKIIPEENSADSELVKQPIKQTQQEYPGPQFNDSIIKSNNNGQREEAVSDVNAKKLNAMDSDKNTDTNIAVKSNKKEQNDELLNSLIKKYGSKNRKDKRNAEYVDIIEKEKNNTANKVIQVDKNKDVTEKVIANKTISEEAPKQKETMDNIETVPVNVNTGKNEQNPTTTSIYFFVSDYVAAYRNRDYEMMKNLFMPGASENNMDLSRALEMYKLNFNKNKIIRYDIQIKNKSVNGNNAFVDGNFVVIYKNNDDDKVNTKQGDISWKLKWIKEEWKINSLNYKFNQKDNYL